MVEFMSGYQPPMDRQFDEVPLERTRDIQEPIIPISELGTTSFDGLQGGILRDVDQKIRIGAKKIQLVIGGNPQGMSSFAGSHGKLVRQELREKALATGIEITGVELAPQKISNLSGMGRGGFSEETRHEQLGHVKDAIKFAADVAGGGGIDIFSQEFQRNVLDAKWNKDEKGNKMFFEGTPDELKSDEQWRKEGKDPQEYRPRTVKYLIDKRTGQVMQNSQVMTGDKVYRVQYSTAADLGFAGKEDPKTHKILKPTDYCDIEGNLISNPYEDTRAIPKFDEKKKTYVVKTVEWKEIEKEAEEKKKPVEEFLYEEQIDARIRSMKGQVLYYGQPVQEAQQAMRQLQKQEEALRGASVEELRQIERMQLEQSESFHNRTKEEKEQMLQSLAQAPKEILLQRFQKGIAQEMEKVRRQLEHTSGHQQQAAVYAEQVEELEDMKRRIATPEQYGKSKTFDSYAEAGIAALQESQRLKAEAAKTGRKVKDIYVGPELGWAGQMYGGHPDEFIEIVQKSRDTMVEKLKGQGYDESAAKEAAKKHIKGMLDTSHLSMWYKHFAPKDGESEEKRLKRFNEWMKEKVQKMVTTGTVGGVQVVDSITGDHAHLPAGQGIFDMVGIVQEMKRMGFNGPIVSEGHEEDTINPGRILTATWEAFGSPIQGVTPGASGSRTWGGVQNAYFGHATRGPNYIVGGYAPSNDWQLWSETPFE